MPELLRGADEMPTLGSPSDTSSARHRSGCGRSGVARMRLGGGPAVGPILAGPSTCGATSPRLGRSRTLPRPAAGMARAVERKACERDSAVLRTCASGSRSEAAGELVNATRYGLVTGLCTGDMDSALRLVSWFDSGMVKVNGPTTGADFHASFGGEQESGYGPAEQGRRSSTSTPGT
ncbi:aldehyde dehydrogenase family protein [Streptomyces sp. NPDC000151]|uniref:aldehyde dehydrogenase family protein n=1 Tax=Streptomyces sp. NPDC000151 TaxID=3154244 RepID=UPI00332C3103